MLAIKLQRIGKKHQPSYRVVVAEKRSKPQGPPVEDLGSYNSFTKKAVLYKERLAHWLKVGAQPTATVHNLLVHEGVLLKPKRAIKMTSRGQAQTGTQTDELSRPKLGEGADKDKAAEVAPVAVADSTSSPQAMATA